jgi:hypothetical protein
MQRPEPALEGQKPKGVNIQWAELELPPGTAWSFNTKPDSRKYPQPPSAPGHSKPHPKPIRWAQQARVVKQNFHAAVRPIGAR